MELTVYTCVRGATVLMALSPRLNDNSMEPYPFKVAVASTYGKFKDVWRESAFSRGCPDGGGVQFDSEADALHWLLEQ